MEHQINQQLTRRMGKPHHSSLLIGDLNGRLAKTDPGSGPVILDNICSKGWIPFLSTVTKGTRLYPVRTFWRGKGRRTCPDHALLHRNSENLLQPSGAYVLEELTELSDGHHIFSGGGWSDPAGYEVTQGAPSIQETDHGLSTH